MTNTDLKQLDLSVLNLLRDMASSNAIEKGFKDPPGGLSPDQWHSSEMGHIRLAVYVANQHGEASELWEAARAGTLNDPCDKAPKMEAMGLPPLTNAEEEVADQIIRLLDTAAELGVDLNKAVKAKMLYNASRPHRHGGKKA